MSGIALADDSRGKTHLFILCRGSNPWTEDSFDEKFEYTELDATYVPSPILHVDAHSGQLFEAFGDDLFILPHGISIAKDAMGEPIALFVTDLARHQVMKFAWNEWSKPALILGQRNKAGNDEQSFCEPADVAVASTVRELSRAQECTCHAVPNCRRFVLTELLILRLSLSLLP